MRRALPLLLAVALLAGCGRQSTPSRPASPSAPVIGVGGGQPEAAQSLGFPGFATKNTTRIGGADAVADAAAAAQAVFPGAGARPSAVVLADKGDWRGAIAASVLMAAPVRAPLLLTDGTSLPSATADALDALAPGGGDAVGGGQVVRIGDVAQPPGLKSTDVRAGDPFALASSIDRLATAAAGAPSPAVVVAGADAPAYAMPAAAWAAKSGDPVLYATRTGVPAPTRSALRRHQRPHIYVLGPPSAVGPAAMAILARYGPVTRIAGRDPLTNAIAFAGFASESFGWNVNDPGHGLVFANASQPVAAAAAAPLSASGSYGPLLVVTDAAAMPRALAAYLADLRPGYTKDPVRGVYNHAWLIGDASALSTTLQARIDTLLEISPVNAQSTP